MKEERKMKKIYLLSGPGTTEGFSKNLLKISKKIWLITLDSS